MSERVCFSLLLLSMLVLLRDASAQLTVSNPTVANSKIASAPDYATEVLSDPWDMDNAADLASFVPVADTGSGLTSVAISGGNLNFTIASADNAYFHLLSPGQCSTNPLGRNGQAFPIDTTKYRYLSIRMYTTAASELRVLWYKGCSYASDWVRTSPTDTLQGWHTYTIDLASIGRETNSGGDIAWSASSATGLRIDPGYSGDVSIAWVRLTGTPPSGSSDSFAYSFSASGADTRHSMFLDDDSDPFNGFISQKVTDAASAGSVDVDSDYLAPGSYRIVGVASDDYATLRGNPWDMGDSGDIPLSVGLGTTTFSNGTFAGTASGDAYFFLNLLGGTIDPSIYRYLCFRIDASKSGNTFVVWYDSSNNASLGFYTVNVGDNTYALDLTTIPTSGSAWTSQNWSKLRVSLPTSSGANDFSVSWVALRQNGCSSSDTTPSPVVSPGSVIVNSPPSVKILQPDNRGGADYASTVLGDPWNFDGSSDVASYAFLSAAEIYPNNYVDGLQGDFFRGVSTEGAGDPYAPVLEQSATSTSRLDTSRFKNLVYRLNVARTQDVTNGSVVRVIWQAAGDGDASPFNGDDQITQEGWNEYVQDMTKIELEPELHSPGSYSDPAWHGSVNYFRIDPHEFSSATEFYFDYIRLTADDETNSQFAITYALEDSDDEAADVSVSFYYSLSESLSGGQAIVSNLPMSRDSRVYLWDTSALAAGTYYVYAVATDRLNSITRAATGRLVKSSLAQDAVAPLLVLDQPTSGRTIYSSMLVSGYALDDIQTANVEVYADGELLHDFRPSLFSKLARSSHPTYSESSNAGFFERVDTSALSDGAHQIVVKVYDTGGNLTLSGSIPVTKVAGTDPDPIPDPSAENETPTAIEGAPATLTLAVKLNAAKNSATLRVTGGISCSQIEIQASEKKSDLAKTIPTGTTLKSVGGTQTVSLVASKLKSLKPKKAASGKSTDVPVYIAALCNGQRTSTVKKVQPVNLSSAKKLATPAKWIQHFGSKLR